MFFRQCNMFVILLITLQCEAGLQHPPLIFFESPGQNQVFVVSGTPVQTVSGKPSLTNVSLEQCAVICQGQNERCNCCTNFKYSAQKGNGTCFLQNISGSSIRTKSSEEGFQSYRIWGESSVTEGYTGDMNESISVDLTAPLWYIPPKSFLVGFSTLGWGVMPLYEGKTINSIDGYDQLAGLTPLECAQECNKVNTAQQDMALFRIRLNPL
eukprot:TRINITY_DN1910_c1_g1_i5.p1 TRINITY_DN1910_c1_g1~~TRINITY_DN1910_c1_g1_i5.p1  ORF type:complete len:220 (-),score=-1.07 TRINITY_DN1910_c1_g1_i5:9-641(-)